MTAPNAHELLYELSQAIDASVAPEPMLQRFLAKMRCLLNGRGAAVLELRSSEPAGIAPPPIVCLDPGQLARDPGYIALWERWSPADLAANLSQHPSGGPIVTADEHQATHVFRLPGFGLLIFIRDASVGALSPELQHGISLLAVALAQAAAVTETRRRARRLDEIIELAGIGVWEWNLDTEQLAWDERMLAQFGLRRQDFGGHLDDWLARIHPPDRNSLRELVNDVMRGQQHQDLEYRIIRPDGETRHLRSLARSVQSSSEFVDSILGITLDLTDLRRAEADNLAKSQLIVGMSQEIRATLADILGVSELALDTELDPAQREYVNIIESSAKGLLDLLDGLLDFAKIEAGGLRIDEIPFNLSIMVNEIAASLATTARDKGLDLIHEQPRDLPPRSLGDPGRIRQILTNLCEAAIQATASGQIRIEISALPIEEPYLDEIRFSILGADLDALSRNIQSRPGSLNGLDPEDTRRFSATRLGPGICARLIEHMGGRLWTDGQPDPGLHFTLPLPRLPPIDPPAPAAESWPGKRALIVDDHAGSRRTLAYWLKQWGFSIQEARNGRRALDLALACQGHGAAFDVHVFDAALPELDGFQLAKRLVEEGLAKQGRLIMLASAGQRGDAQRCRELGIHAFLTKPVTPLELRETLGRVLSGSESTATQALLTRHDLIEHRPRLRVLLVENNPVSQKLARTLMSEWGHEVVVADNGCVALERFQPATYDLVFMDLHMPVMDGLKTTRAIRKLEAAGQRTPIIGMAARILESDREQCLAAGMDEHIGKPLQPQVLAELTRKFTANRARHDD